MHSSSITVRILGWWGAFPKAGGACACVLVQTAQGSLLLDCGCGSLSQYYRHADIASLAGVLVSHLHFDHVSDLGSLFYAVNYGLRTGLRDQKLPVYAPATPERLRCMVEYPFARTHTLADGQRFSLMGIDITAKKVSHTVECYAFRLEYEGKSLVYLTDTSYLPDAGAFACGADLLLSEATISEGTRHTLGNGHMTDIEAGKVAREGGVKSLCLIHLPSDGDLGHMRRRAASEYGGEVFTPDIRSEFLL